MNRSACAALFALLGLAASPAQAAIPAAGPAAGPALAACDAGHETVLHVAPPLPALWAEARAAWLDGARLRWAGVAVDGAGRFRLLHSRTGQLRLAEGATADGVDSALVLDLAAAAAPVDSARRFSHIGPGVVLALRAADRGRVADLLRGQVMLVREDAQGRVQAATALQVAGALDALHAAAAQTPQLGAQPRRGRTRFSVWAPTAQRVALCVYAGADAPAAALRPMARDARTGSWSVSAAGVAAGRYYAFVVDVFVPGRGLVRNLVTDPYSLSLGADSTRSYVAAMDSPALAPPGWHGPRPRLPRVPAATDQVVYELSVRDFSAGAADVPATHRGKYLAFTHETSAGMRHLARLAAAGATDVHLLPVFDLATVPERGCTTPAAPAAAPDSTAQQAAVMAGAGADCFNWGYDPWHFNAPEGSFATDAADGAVRVREFRAMVLALHRLGLRVGMDMVYNHTTASGQHARSVLDRIVPGYYHRLDAKGTVERSTCCDNTATEHRMMERLMIDSAVAWVRHYRIDSMRFDLMGHQPRDAMLRLQRAVDRAAGRRVHLIGEGWNFGEVKDGARFVQAAQRSLNGSGIGTFSDRGRDAARGSAWGSPEDTVRNRGWIHGGDDTDRLARQADLLRVGLAGTLEGFEFTDRTGARVPAAKVDYGGQGAGYASQPTEVVNYVENHDNQTLFDNNVTKLPRDTSPEDRARVQVLGAALVAFSQGVAYLHAGQEILRSKSLDRNSYDSGDWFNRLDWTLQDNGFGAGLPPERDNREHWPVMQPLLAAAASMRPSPQHIAWTRDAVADLLRIRSGSTLFRLRTAAQVQRRLSFPNSGPVQEPRVVVGHLDGQGLPGAQWRALVYAVNADTQARTVDVPAARGKAFVLHPVHRAAEAADPRPARESAFDAASGRLTVPPRTALVYVLP